MLDRRAFMALLGLGPAFRRLVPVVAEPLYAIGPRIDVPGLHDTPYLVLLRSCERVTWGHFRWTDDPLVPYAAPPEESQDE